MNKEELLKLRLREQDVELPGVGSVRIRALSRAEVLRIKDKPMDIDVMERKLISAAMVDPKLTEAEVQEWQDVSEAGELEIVTRAITKLSGLSEGAGKSGL